MKRLLLLFVMFLIVTISKGQNWTTYTSSELGVDGGIYSILQDQYNDFWFGSWTQTEGTNGLSNYWGSDGNKQWWHIGPGGMLIGDYVRAIFQDSSETYWFGTTTGVTRFNFNTGGINYTTAEGLVDDYIFSIIQDTDGNMWFGTAGGVSKFDGSTWTNYTTDDNAGLYSINSVIQDANGDFWFASVGGGVTKFDGVSTWTNYATENSGLVADDVFVVMQDSNNDYWFATYSGNGISKFDGINWTTYTTADGLSSNKVRVITQDSFGDLWFGTNAGLSKFNGTTWATYTTADGLIPGGVRAITQDNNDDLWIGTWSSGVSKFEISKVTIPDPNFEQSLIDLGIDSDGIINQQILRSDALAVTDLNLTNPLFQSDGFENPLITTVTGKIADLTGIEAFENLTSLQLGNGDLTSVDISKNTKLDNLFFNDNQLASIDVSNNILLKRFGVMRNPGIGTLNVSNNLLLEELFVSTTAMTNIDVSMNTNLWKFYGRWGNLTGIDLSQNSNLRDVRLRGSSGLTYVNVKNGNNSNMVGFDVRDMPSLSCITADGIAEPEVSALMLGYSNGLLSTDCGTVYIPDANFEQALIDLGYDSDTTVNGLLLRSDAELVTSLNVGSKNISDLSGIEAFTNLIELYPYDNQLTALNVSNNILLENLFLNDNQVLSLDLSNNTLLNLLNIDRNSMENLTLGNHPDLSIILGSGNALNSIDVTNCPALITLSVGGSRLTNLDVTGNSSLEEIIVHWNLLTELDISSNPNVSFLLCEGNQLTSLNIANGNNLNFSKPASATYTDYSFNALNNNLECIQVDPDVFFNIPIDWIKESTTIYSTDCATIPEVYIPDPNFEQALIDLEIDSDGVVNSYILRTDAEAVTGQFDVSNKSIGDLTGIEAFINITDLKAGGNQLKNIDLSTNTNLTKLDLENNQLTVVDLSGLVNLTFLNLVQNQIAAIDLSNNTELEILYLESNLLTGAGTDISQNTKLRNIAFGYNQMTSLDVSKNTELWAITLEGTQLITLDVSQNEKLTNLVVNDNPLLTQLDVSQNPLLFSLIIYNTSITGLNLSNNPISNLVAGGNPDLTFLNMRNGNNLNVTNFKLWTTPNLSCVNADGTTLTELSQKMLDSGKTFSEDCGTVYIPDANFENYLETHDVDGIEVTLGNSSSMGDGVLNHLILRSDAESVVGTLNVANKGIADLTGIEAFVNITRLYAATNSLTSVNITQNVLLERLDLIQNQIAAIDLSNNTELDLLWLESNLLTGAGTDISQNTKLRNIAFGYNQMTSLDVSKNPELWAITAEGNQLTTIDVSNNEKLTNLWLVDNLPLSQLDVSKNQLLFSLGIWNTAITGLDLSNNPITHLWASQNPNLTFIDMRNGNNLNVTKFQTWGTPNLTCINVDDETADFSAWQGVSEKTFSEDCGTVYIPDPNFEQALIDLEIDIAGIPDHIILKSDAEAVIGRLNVSNKNISDLTGIEAFINLTELNSGDNLLTNIDISNNTELIKIWMYRNQLSSLDLSNNIKMQRISAGGNQLTELDVSMLPDVHTILAWQNQLTGIDVSNNPLLDRVHIETNQISTIDVSNNPLLTWLRMFSNQVSSIDVSNNPLLDKLEIGDNQLSQLDISSNPIINTVSANDNVGLKLLTTAIAGSPSLTSLNLSGTGLSNFNTTLYPSLEQLLLNNNSLSKLTTTSIPNLKNLYVNNNVINSLDLTSNTLLEGLFASNNKLTDLNAKNGNNVTLTQFDVSSNLLTCITVDNDIDANNGVAPYDIWITDIGVTYSLDCKGEPEVVLIPDENFETALGAYDTNGVNGNILLSDALLITSLNVSGKSISDLTGIEAFENLLNLDCSVNNLTNTLDLTTNVNLETFNCSSNSIDELLITGSKNLTALNASSNNLFAIDLSQNSSLTLINVADNYLTNLMISSTKSLTQLNCKNNAISNINLVDLTSLMDLDISFNSMVTIDARNLNQLTTVNVSNNQLLELDMRNGANTSVLSFDATNNSLGCIGVDDTIVPANWFKDLDTGYTTSGDCLPPVVITKDITIQIDAKGVAVIGVDDIDNGSYDNATPNKNLIFSLSQTVFGCIDLGQSEVTLTVTDQDSNESMGTAIVTTEDLIDPQANSIRSLFYDLMGDSELVLATSDIDNGSTDNCGVPILSLSQDTFTMPGFYTVVLTATDASGNSATSETEVEITNSSIQGNDLKFGGITLTVYPVPFSDIINISFSKPTDPTTATVELLNFGGTSTGIQFYSNGQSLYSDDTSGLVQMGGSLIYWLRVTVGNKTETIEILKQ